MGLALLAAAACGGDPNDIVGPDPDVAPFVGIWDATAFTVTNLADTSQVADLMINGSFFVNVQPSGSYTATLIWGSLPPLTEIGTLEVAGNFVTLRSEQNDPNCVSPSAYTFPASDQLTLDGPTCFDFNLDGTPEDADAHIELMRR